MHGRRLVRMKSYRRSYPLTTQRVAVSWSPAVGPHRHLSSIKHKSTQAQHIISGDQCIGGSSGLQRTLPYSLHWTRKTVTQELTVLCRPPINSQDSRPIRQSSFSFLTFYTPSYFVSPYKLSRCRSRMAFYLFWGGQNDSTLSWRAYAVKIEGENSAPLSSLSPSGY